MSKLFLTNINLNGNQLLNAVIHKAATAPTSPTPVSGQVYFNTGDGSFYVYDGSTWDKLAVSGSIVNADIAANAAIDTTKILNFDTQVRTSRLDQMAAPTASVSMNSKNITNLLDPVNAQDAATKAYVDAARQGLDVKDSVKAASTTNIATLTGTMTVDTVSLSVGDRVLIKDQTTQAQNGIYVVAAGAWSRSTDADTATKLTSGAFVFVEQGSQSDSGWVMTQDAAITLGTTAITWAQFSGAGQITAGAGLTKTGNTIDVTTASSARIVVNTDSIDLATVTASNTTPSMGTTAVTGVTVDSYGRVTGVATSTTKYASQNTLLTVTSGSAAWTVTHNLGTSDVVVQVRQVADNAIVEADIVITSSNIVTITIASTAASIAADTYRVVVVA